MWFSLFRSHDTPSDPRAQPSPGSWPWGVADEVEAFLAGRMVDHLVAIGRRVPAWAVLNWLAHTTHEALVELVEAEGAYPVMHPAYGQPSWVMAERFVAARLLAQAATAEELLRIQQEALVPVELAFIARARTEQLNPNQVIGAAAEALDSFDAGI